MFVATMSGGIHWIPPIGLTLATVARTIIVPLAPVK